MADGLTPAQLAYFQEADRQRREEQDRRDERLHRRVSDLGEEVRRHKEQGLKAHNMEQAVEVIILKIDKRQDAAMKAHEEKRHGFAAFAKLVGNTRTIVFGLLSLMAAALAALAIYRG